MGGRAHDSYCKNERFVLKRLRTWSTKLSILMKVCLAALETRQVLQVLGKILNESEKDFVWPYEMSLGT